MIIRLRNRFPCMIMQRHFNQLQPVHDVVPHHGFVIHSQFQSFEINSCVLTVAVSQIITYP